MNYWPHSEQDRRRMLEAIGLDRVERLFEGVPAQARYPRLDLPPALSEMELLSHLRGLAERNQDLDHHPCFLGAGAYRHFVPAVVDSILRRGEFYTAYTPYQAEASQGTLAATYEYQTMICELTGMDVSNASLYEGGSATAEAALMAARATQRDEILIARSVHPAYRQVLRTYVQGLGLPVREIGYGPDGKIDLREVAGALSEATACLILQQPNFLGVLEDPREAAELVHPRGGLLVVVADPIALGLFRPPGEEGADIVAGEGQSLGTPLQFGGPYLGFMACRERYLRQLPGRIVGLTYDAHKRRGFVLTLQAREQHIRREKATSNICTNQALVALATTVYLAAMGKRGLRQVAELCFHKAHYAARRIGSLPGFELPFGEFFSEFAVRTPRPPREINAQLGRRGIIGGYDLGRDYPELGDHWLICVTEMNSRLEIDQLVEALASSPRSRGSRGRKNRKK